jgi:hypothetical protein
MTALRRQQRPGTCLWAHPAAGFARRGAFFCGLFALVAAFQVLLFQVLPVRAATTERIVVDRHTGLAISGFDPVAYFTDAVPRMGVEDYELASSGVTWRFRNEGNMAAFAADPDVYSPQFGGYDPVGVARGVAAAGHPQLWLVHAKKLYLFQSAETRERFSADPDAVRALADEKWPDVERDLVP